MENMKIFAVFKLEFVTCFYHNVNMANVHSERSVGHVNNMLLKSS